MRALAGSGRAVGVALAGAALTLIALAFDAQPLFVPGAAFLLLGISAPAWVRSLAAPTTIDRRLDTDRVIEDEPLEATIEVRGGPLGLLGAQVRDPLAPRPLLLRGGGRTATIMIVARFDRRGLRTVAPPSVSFSDPLGLAQRDGGCAAPAQQVLVLPRTERVHWLGGAAASRLNAPAARARLNTIVEIEVDGLRPYQPGTPASRIHWPALARGAGLLERRLRGDEDFRPLIVLDARGEMPPAQLDAAVRAAASLTFELARAGGSLLLLPGERRALEVEPDLGGWPTAHVRLALIEGGADAPPPMLAAARGRPGPVIYVSAAGLERPPAALGSGATVLVIPNGVATASARPAFEVSGCVGHFASRRERMREAVA
jgi:uncharacterized protein (DUF58 family)